MIPMRALIVKDDACYPIGSPATAYFYSNGDIHGNPASVPLRGKIEWYQ